MLSKILSDEGLNVPDPQRQEQHLRFVESFYQRVRSHITGTSDYRQKITGATEPKRLMPTAYLSPQTPPSVKTPTSSQQQNQFRPSNCGLAINLTENWKKDSQQLLLKAQFSVFLPKFDLRELEQRSLRTLWQRSDVAAEICCTLQELVEPKSSGLLQLNEAIAEQVNEIIAAHTHDPEAWINGLDRTIDDLTPSEIEHAKHDLKQFQLDMRKRVLSKKEKKEKSDREKNPENGQVAYVEYDVKVEAQLRNSGEQPRLRLFLRNKTVEIGGFRDPRDAGIFSAYLEVTLPDTAWQSIELSRFRISYQVDSTVPAQGINCTPGYDDTQPNLVRIWTEFLPVHWQKRLYAPDFNAPFKALASNSRDLQVLNTIHQNMERYQNEWQALIDGKYFQKGGTDNSKEAQEDLDKFKQEVARFQLGIQVLENPKYQKLRRAFNLMNQTFAEIDQKRIAKSKSAYQNWRPFQIVYIVCNLAALAARQWNQDFINNGLAQLDHAAVVHFPTGGGKSEAVMGVILTQAFFDRLRGRDWGVVSWLRYPLRLLTYQQLQRFLETLVVADEIREQQSDLAKTPEFTVGYYGGRANSPNDLRNLPDELQRYVLQAKRRMQEEGVKPSKYLSLVEVGYYVPSSIQPYRMVMRCPYCGSDKVHTFIDRDTNELRHRCGGYDEPLSEGACGREIPLYIVDEDIYSRLPTLVVGTLDKIANITFRPASRTLFGGISHVCTVHGFAANHTCHKQSFGTCTRRNLKPLPKASVDPGIPLIFQDELHLLREELGTFDGHYEALIDAIHQERGAIRPRILAATATIEGATQQIRHLYWRSLSQFPERGPDRGRSFYANTHSQYVTRGFVGIRPTGSQPLDATMSLLQAIRTELEIIRSEPSRFKVEYGLPTLTDAEFLQFIDEHSLCCTYVNSKNDGSDIRRSINEQVKAGLREIFDEDRANTILPEAVTLSGDDDLETVKAVLQRMETPQKDLDADSQERLSDVVATSMISHGVDIDRLNLMIFYGWTNTTAEYIQASSRAGRTIPGLVFVLLRPVRARERAIFDYFVKAHEYLDQMVETVPIDRFAHNALYRTAFGLLLGRLLHIDGPASRSNSQEIDLAEIDKLKNLRDLIEGAGQGRSPINLKAVVEEVRSTLNPDDWAEGQVFDEPLELLTDAFLSQINKIVQDSGEVQHVTSGLTKHDIPYNFRLLLSLRDVDPGIDVNVY
ncbi:helicase-related protein [Leptolyngbya sp. AN03gr2]|uniref:helicase-related protein n=1 Tax=unclassified Leptolyngbya TaxID=2650499 RepID=UPI003D3130DD